jgi:microcystin-dependent protein
MIKTKKMKSNEAATCQRIATDQARRLTTTVARLSGILAICLWAVSATAETTTFKGMAFQSYLVDSNGAAISGNKSLKFSIFDADSSGNLKWAETQTVTVNAGNFSVILGEGTWDTAAGGSRVDLATVFNGADCYIEIAVDGTSLAPRLRMLPSPYTFHAKNATNATNAQKIISQDGNNTLLVENNKFVMNKPLEVNGEVKATSIGGFGTVPLGGIIMWSGTSAPDGWAICDGRGYENGLVTPDLRNRFVVGSGKFGTRGSSEQNLGYKGYYTGETGGQKNVTLTKEQMPSHTHSGLTKSDGAHSHKGNNTFVVNAGSAVHVISYQASNDTTYGKIHSNGSAHKHSFTTNATGGSQAHENRPPYYALAFIIRVK